MARKSDFLWTPGNGEPHGTEWEGGEPDHSSLEITPPGNMTPWINQPFIPLEKSPSWDPDPFLSGSGVVSSASEPLTYETLMSAMELIQGGDLRPSKSPDELGKDTGESLSHMRRLLQTLNRLVGDLEDPDLYRKRPRDIRPLAGEIRDQVENLAHSGMSQLEVSLADEREGYSEVVKMVLQRLVRIKKAIVERKLNEAIEFIDALEEMTQGFSSISHLKVDKNG